MPTKNGAAFLFFIFIVGILLCSGSYARTRKPIFASSSVYRYNYGFSGLFGLGEMGNDTATSPYRTIDFTTYQAFLGFRLSNYRFSAFGEYSYGAQQKNVAEVANTNLAGQGLAYGPKFEFYDGKQSIGLIYRMNSRYKLNKRDINNNEQNYTSKVGFSVQYTHRLKNQLGIVLDYTREEYLKSLPENVKWDRLSIGLIISNFDKYPYPLN